MNYYIIVFKNTYDAMAGERKLNELNFSFKIMPTPTSIAMSCGICVRIDQKKDIDLIINNNTLGTYEYDDTY